MPELPEVETVRRGLEGALPGHRIERVIAPETEPTWLAWQAAWQVALTGRAIHAVRRRAKYLILDLDDDLALVVHLRMTGTLTIAQADDPPARFHRVALRLDNGTELRFGDMRRFGTAEVLDPAGLAARLASLGPEPLDDALDAAALRAALGMSAKLATKAALLDQRRIAGLGNIYADESLHRAGIHPQTPVGALTDAEIARLTAAIKEVLADGVTHSGTTFDAEGFRDAFGNPGGNLDYLRVYHRHGQPCLTCGTDSILQTRLAGRSTHWCPTCQPERIVGSQ
ncbi:MAG: bifunctional DNA-formamidopyrimidine glycosylase/DNA-(apurinic or apyrimidinic site) lyase [Thermomicrobiales bacterium]